MKGTVGAVDTNGYVTFLVLGVVLVAIDGAIVYRNGRAYLDEAYRDPRASRSITQLVTVLFHLVVLGVLALISIINVNTGNQVQNVVVKLGVVLLVLAAAHAATLSILSHIRDRLRDEQITDEMLEQHENRVVEQRDTRTWPGSVNPSPTVNPTANPVAEEYPNRHPAVSPPIEQQHQFPATS